MVFTMPQFSLAWLLIGVTVVATALAVWVAGRVEGLVVYGCLAMAALTLFSPGPESWRTRISIVLMGASGGVLAFVVIAAAFGDIDVGRGWYRSNAPVAGGWSAGLMIAAWRASHVYQSKADERPQAD